MNTYKTLRLPTVIALFSGMLLLVFLMPENMLQPLVADTGLSPAAASSAATSSSASHTDPFSYVLIQIGFIILVAMIGKRIAAALGQPSVLGELLIGVVVGNFGYWLGVPLATLIMHARETQQVLDLAWTSGISFAQAANQVFSSEELRAGAKGAQLLAVLQAQGSGHVMLMAGAFWIFSNLGVILLLFAVGLESKVSELLRVGVRASAVAVVGVVVPFLLGLGAGYAIFPELSVTAHLFIAATLCATSVGITARVFKDLNRIKSDEAKIILGAAVLDDILGLIILAVMAGMVVTGGFSAGEALRISLVSVVFLGAVIFLGERLIARLVPFMSWLDADKVKLLFPFALCCLLAWVANQIGLATIVGAFAAGLVLSDEQFTRHSSGKQTLAEVLQPIEAIFAPMFFVVMGMQVNLAIFSDGRTVVAALLLTIAAIVGKLFAGLVAGKGVDRLSIGIGMVPRGEVGLIFAGIGRGLGVIGDALFSGLVILIAITTIVAPPALSWSLKRGDRARQAH